MPDLSSSEAATGDNWFRTGMLNANSSNRGYIKCIWAEKQIDCGIKWQNKLPKAKIKNPISFNWEWTRRFLLFKNRKTTNFNEKTKIKFQVCLFLYYAVQFYSVAENPNFKAIKKIIYFMFLTRIHLNDSFK